MFRLGLQLTLRSGREALVRLLITAAAVAMGVALLLGVLAEFHAYQVNANKQCWSCTQGAAVPSTLPSHGDLWNNSVDFYQGQTISRLDVAALGPNAPVPPGITHLPPAGDYYASPALAALLRTVPAGELGARFPGKMIGTIGQAGLDGAGDLAIYIGHTPAQLSKIPGTQWVRSINRGPAQEVFSPFFRFAFGIGVLAVVFPMLVLISTATRLAADRREERFAALRLVGGTPGDIRIVASVEAMISAFLGAVLGTAIFLLVRSALAGAALVGTQYFESDLTPTAAGYVAMLVGVPVAAAIAALVSLRRVQISPLGVTRRATPKPPTFWRLIPLVIGVGVFVYGLSKTTRDGIGAPAYPGLLLTMIGLVIVGPWLTAWAAWLFSRFAHGSSALLAARRLADNPKGAFRAVTGLTLAVFLGTMVGLIVPALNATEQTPTAGALSNILIDQVGMPAAAGQQLISGITAIRGATVYPLYDLQPPGEGLGPTLIAVSCADMRAIAGLGRCAPGVRAVQVMDNSLFDDNPIYDTKPIVELHLPGVHRKAEHAAAADGPGQGERPRDARAGPHLPRRPRAAAGWRQLGELADAAADVRRDAPDQDRSCRAVREDPVRGGRAHADRGRMQPRGLGRRRPRRPEAPVHPAAGERHTGERAVARRPARGGGAADSRHRGRRRHRLRDVRHGVPAARAGRHRDPAARPRLLHDHGHRPRGRLRGHHADAATAPQDDGTLDRPLRIAARPKQSTAFVPGTKRCARAPTYVP